MKIKVNEHVNVTLSTPKCAAEVAKVLTADETGEKIEVSFEGTAKLADAGRFIGAMKHLHQEGKDFAGNLL